MYFHWLTGSKPWRDSRPGYLDGCFGCSTAMAGTFRVESVDVLDSGDLSLVTQVNAVTLLGRRFSYCLVPNSVNASSALQFGARATVTEPGAATTA
ncbi:aspartic proteinase CDR1 [Hordeum vulgare]|nr:aspartic proteinase CDR1 [Hordeum vulgare]